MRAGTIFSAIFRVVNNVALKIVGALLHGVAFWCNDVVSKIHFPFFTSIFSRGDAMKLVKTDLFVALPTAQAQAITVNILIIITSVINATPLLLKSRGLGTTMTSKHGRHIDT